MANQNYQNEILQPIRYDQKAGSGITTEATRLTDTRQTRIGTGGGVTPIEPVGPLGGGVDPVRIPTGLQPGTYNFRIRTVDQSDRETIHSFNVRVIGSAESSDTVNAFLTGQVMIIDSYRGDPAYQDLTGTANQTQGQ